MLGFSSNLTLEEADLLGGQEEVQLPEEGQ